jgi:hypothetical protein
MPWLVVFRLKAALPGRTPISLATWAHHALVLILILILVMLMLPALSITLTLIMLMLR